MVKVLGRKQDGSGWSLALEQEPEVQAALISLSTITGQVKSMVGGYDYNKSQFNRAVQAIRQPGSAFKPIIYAAAVNQGYGPSSIIIDSPIIFKEKKDAFEKWKPVNFEEKFYGPTSLREALAHSRNVVTVKLMQKIGIKSTIRLARSLGITTNLEENLSIALGSSGTTLYELTSAYSAFANLGNMTKPTVIRNIKSRQGKVLFTAEPDTTQPISSETAHIMTSLMQSVVQNGTATKIKSLKRPVAGKTGTTNNYVDAWFIGYTPELVTGVWVGKDKDKPLGRNETGSRAAIPIWLQFMQKVLANKPTINFPVSSNIQFIKVQSKSGKPAKYRDTSSSFELFSQDFLPEKEQPFIIQTQQSAETFQ
jgi:penicillin-binding protein 1A